MLSHVAMSVPEGTLTDAYRSNLLEFDGRALGWREMESFRRPDRLTERVGRGIVPLPISPADGSGGPVP